MVNNIKTITLYQPEKIVFGAGTFCQIPDECLAKNFRKVLLLFASPLKTEAGNIKKSLTQSGVNVHLVEYLYGEPTVVYFNSLLEIAKNWQPDAIIGIGGGSVLDSAKLMAALFDSEQKPEEVFGSNLLHGRNCALICVPTTSGTGSEVSPNAILLDENDSEKKAVVSPYLVPDSCYIDPELMTGLPPSITAETAMDALSHCIEAFTNKFSHPVVDNYALAGIKFIVENLETAYKDGNNLDARAALALGSMYGGMCLGPVNTAAVHALSYGLGGKYHISHGLANAILLPEVMKFNMDACLDKYKTIAHTLGVNNVEEGIEKIRNLSIVCGIPQKLTDIGIDLSETANLADLAMNVTRLLVNNPKEMTREDAINIYNALL